jgi:hypothetical protein
MKQNLRILKLNLEIDRLRNNLEDTRIRNLKLEIKTRNLFEKIRTLNMIQTNKEFSEKWKKEIKELDTILEESEIEHESSSDKSIRRIFLDVSKEFKENSKNEENINISNKSTYELKTKNKNMISLNVQTSQYDELMEKINNLELSIVKQKDEPKQGNKKSLIENPLNFTEWLINSFEQKLTKLKNVLNLNIVAKGTENILFKPLIDRKS